MARREKARMYIRRIAIVGDGVTEKIYFEQLREIEHIKNVVIKPELPGKPSKGASYKKVINTAKALIEEGYSHVYGLIDFDTVLSENKVVQFTQELKAIDNRKITIYVNNPCFETWLLLHYEKTGKPFTNCDRVVKAMAKHLKDYCKNQEYLRKKNLYRALRPHLKTKALPNAEFLETDRDEKGNNYPRAEVYKFFLKENIVKIL